MNVRDEDVSNDWVLALCSIVFDIDEGQKLEASFPQNALSTDEENDVAFHSFPVRPLFRAPTSIPAFRKSCQEHPTAI